MRYPTRASEFAQPSSYRSCLLHRAIASSYAAGANRPDRPLTAKWLDYEHQSSCAKTGSRTGSSNPTMTSSTTAATPGTSSRSTLADHVHRNARLGLRVLITESWYSRELSRRRPVSQDWVHHQNFLINSVLDEGPQGSILPNAREQMRNNANLVVCFTCDRVADFPSPS
jgi:hypothetical protein